MVLSWAGLERQDTTLRRAIAVLLTASLLAVIAFAVPSRAAAATVSGPNGISLTVTPTEIDDLTDQVLVTVSGTGYSTTANNAFGVYVSFGPEATEPGHFTDVDRYYNGGGGFGTIWVTPGTPNGPNQAKLESNGSFSIQLAVKATYTGGSVDYDGTVDDLGVLSYAAHGTEATTSFSQYAFVPLTFEEPGEPATAPAAPAAPAVTTASTSALNVSWTAPSDGGEPITGYTVTLRSNSGTSVVATANLGVVTSTQFTGLAADSSYNAIVAATNDIGTSANSAQTVGRTAAAPVAADFSGLRWKVSHQVWTSTSLAGISPADGGVDGHIVTGGASRGPDGFLFPTAATGTYDPATGESTSTFAGTVEFGNTNQGGYRIRFSDPSIAVNAAGDGTITAGLSYRTATAVPFSAVTRIPIATFDVAPSKVTTSTGHVVIQTLLDTAFAPELLDPTTGVPASLVGHFTPTTTGNPPVPNAANPLKVPSPIAAGFDVPIVDDPLSAVIEITTEVVETGALVLSVDDTSVQLTSPTLAQDGSLHATGELGDITVVDLRSSDPGWNVTGQVGDFLGPDGASIDGAGLSWSPEVVSSSPGQVVTAGDSGDGLEDGQTLGSAEEGEGRGTAVLGAGLDLEVPSITPPGAYTGRLTLTAI